MELREGYKQTEVGVIPIDWNVHPLRKLLKESPKYGINAPAVPLKGNLPTYIRITDIDKDGYFNSGKAVAVSHQLSENYIVEEGDILLARTGASVGKSYIYRESDGKLVYAGFLIKVSPNEQFLESRYFFQYLKTSSYWRWVSVMSMRSGQPGINGNEYGALTLPLPPTKAEQTAIATALSDVDALITQLEKLITKKRQIKQGAMQTLLNPFDENGSLKAGWEKKTLGDVCPNIRRGELITSHMLVIGDIPVIAGGKKPAYFHNKPNRSGITITISASGANAGFVNIFNTPIFASDCSTISESGYYDIFYIYYSLIYRQHEIYNAQTGGAQPHIHPKDLSPMIIGLPQDIDKQLKISETLRTMDLEITALETKLAKTKKLKQGMMQSLLTGQIRLVDPTPTPKNKQ